MALCKLGFIMDEYNCELSSNIGRNIAGLIWTRCVNLFVGCTEKLIYGSM
jgi:hypothetical protein